MIPLTKRSRIINNDERLTCLREGATTYVNGIATHAPGTAFAVQCNVQPLTGREMLLLAEADRERETFWIWVQETAGQTMIRVNDFVMRTGRVYRILQASDWGSYTQARMTRQDTGPDLSLQFAPPPPTSQ